MKLVYALEPIPYSMKMVFLAGPTPRSNDVKSWRPEMVDILTQYFMVTHLNGKEPALVIPEDRTGKYHGNYDHQTEWEYLAISSCDVLLFWIPRDVAGGMPGFTSNIELGYWLREKHIILGYPETAEKMSYPSWLYQKVTRRTPKHTMREAALEVVHAIRQCSSGG